MDLPDAEDMPQVAYGSSNIPYDVWSTEEHHHWHVPNKELCNPSKEEQDVVGRRLDKLSNCPNLEVLDQACKDLDLGQDFRDYGVAIAGADVVISLSTSEKDTLILPSDVLIKASPWFRSALDDRWISNKVTGIRNFNGQDIIMKRFELEYDNDHGDQLFGKTSITTEKDRISVLPASTCYDEASYVDESDLLRYLITPGPLTDGDPSYEPEDNEVEHSATVIANKIALSIICNFPLKLNRSVSIWGEVIAFDTLVVLKLLQWFSTYLVPLDKVAHAILEYIFSTDARDEIREYAWTYLRISYVLQSRELFTTTLYATNWDFDLQDVSPDARRATSLFHCVARIRAQVLEAVDYVEKRFLVLWPSAHSSAAILARNIWIDYLQINLLTTFDPQARHARLAAFALGWQTAQQIFSYQWMTDPSHHLKESRPYEQLLIRPDQKAATMAALDDIVDQAISTTRKLFTEMTTRYRPDSSFYAIDMEVLPYFYTPWSPRDAKESRTNLARLVETASLQYDNEEEADQEEDEDEDEDERESSV